jgi:hypothetical protein
MTGTAVFDVISLSFPIPDFGIREMVSLVLLLLAKG